MVHCFTCFPGPDNGTKPWTLVLRVLGSRNGSYDSVCDLELCFFGHLDTSGSLGRADGGGEGARVAGAIRGCPQFGSLTGGPHDKV